MEYRNPWKTLSTRHIYENPWLRLREDQVIRPDGKEGIYGVVDTRLAVGVIALTPQMETYLVGQWRYPLNKYSWEIIEGGGDLNEDGLITAKRELKEEAGLVAKKWRALGGEVHLSNCFSSERAVFFVAEDLEQLEAEPEGTEELEIRKIKFLDALAMVDSGEITDAMSIIALNRLRLELDKKSL
jgi:8-oxo-dGTP pyrophosphatase MutT (NUDIX family)